MESGIFSVEWKMDNVITIHIWDDKRNFKNYQPISILPIFRKIFERLICNEMYLFFIENDLISPNQSGFKQENSCINQFLSIAYDI